MIVFPKKDIIPIIVPQICFIDKYNDLNSYTEMNPSLFIEEDGTTTILVRCVNYKIFNNKTRCSGPFPFTLHQTNSNSIYYLLKGKIKDTKKVDVENFEYQIVETNLNLQKYLTYWLGLEDIRFLDSNNILVIVPELNMDGKPSIFKAELNNNQITNFISCKPDKIEKNWMPYSYNNLSKVIYSLDPFIIKTIEIDDKQEIKVPELIKCKLKGYHGSTNGIPFSQETGEMLFLIHINRERSYNRFMLFNIITNEVQLSEEFIFFKNSYIEFTCSLSKYCDRIFIAIGVNDNKAYIIEINIEDVKNVFPKVN